MTNLPFYMKWPAIMLL
ncbi:hypothetical protein F383_16457 [Gossypium arboreum]|uniref:Uncharacterized protein n=1 Tax=Gossypium arboreum TaxID=29729 RepID=A0A0B0MYA3_GOSAR|nr:hypothetical protein F383_30915 [Gossypium arboreum]KHG09738.1 hypothetical protein F383_16457 [Gossypium arboreum]